MPSIQISSVFPGSRKEIFEFLFRDEAWDRGIPPIFESELLESGPFREKTIIKWRLTCWGVSFNWAMRVDSIKSNERVVLSQFVGPFQEWVHTVELLDHGNETSKLVDTIEYQLPLGLLGCILDDLVLRRELSKVFEGRHEKLLSLRSKNHGGV